MVGRKYIRYIGLAFLALFIMIGGFFLYTTFGAIKPVVISGTIKPASHNTSSPFTRQEGNMTNLPLDLIDGLSLDIYADGFTKPRVMVFDSNGNMLVSDTEEGTVTVLRDNDNDYKVDERIVLLENLNKPHGLAIDCGADDYCDLYVATTDKIDSYEYDANSISALFRDVVVDLPDGGRHYTRTIEFEPGTRNSKLIVSIGSSCNVCYEDDERYASIISVDIATGQYELYAQGLRNSVFMTINSDTGDVWATEMGRDWLGDDLPPDEVNIIKKGQHYGWPVCYGKNIHDTDFDTNTYIRTPCSDPFEQPSFIDIPAHSSPLGIAFIPTDSSFPEEYHGDLLVALHGSWNRDEPTGYKIIRYHFDDLNGYSQEYTDFITGWLSDDNTSLGRPVDIVVENGTIFITDDKTGTIYMAYFSDDSGENVEASCIKTGCSGHICSDEPVVSTCEFKAEYACYQQAVCERQEDGTCGFTLDSTLSECLENSKN